MNWLDGVIAVGILLFMIAGLRRGFLIGLVEIIGIIVSVSIPLFFYIPGSRLLERSGLSQVYSGALSFVILFFITISIYFAIAEKLYKRIPLKIHGSRVNRVFGLLPGLLKGILIIILLIAVIVVLPVPLITSKHIEKSYFGSRLLDSAAAASSLSAHIFGEAFQHAVGFITIEPEAVESVDLPFRSSDPLIDQEAEEEMLRLLNQERALQGLSELVMDETLREIARKHSVDMLQRGYFSHIDPEGNTPFDRMQAGGASFSIAGENLALAPTISIAHQGLMNSPGHRENILLDQYHRVGIGAASDNRYGIMFTQKFSD